MRNLFMASVAIAAVATGAALTRAADAPFVGSFELTTLQPDGSLDAHSVVMIHADGTVVSRDNPINRFTGTPSGPFFGTWEQTGPRQIAGTITRIIFDATGTRKIATQSVDFVLDRANRASFSGTFVFRFSGQSQFCGLLGMSAPCDFDPWAEPDAAPPAWTLKGRRIGGAAK